MRLRDTFAENLRRARRAAGLSQEELAHAAEIDRTYISALERAVYSATVDVIERLADALKVEPAELFVRPRRRQSS
ncbi:MAG: helix-turn-helix domain-containing protein [Alphaproteobacteria bacterium]|nr:helix-turn-helix domain-containing protein [Alphaproteobacteria bacterium]